MRGAKPPSNAAQERNANAVDVDRDIAHLIDCSEGGIARVPRETLVRLRALLTAPRAGLPHHVLASLECTAVWLEKGNDPQDAARELRACLAKIDAAPAAPVADVAPNVVEAIAEQWDGCMYAAPGIDIDIGEAIRAAAKRLDAAPAAQAVAADGAACKGKNCGATDGVSHSPECVAEHEAAVSGAVAADGEAQDDIEGIARAAGCTNVDLIGDRAKAIERLTAFAVRVRAAVSPATAPLTMALDPKASPLMLTLPATADERAAFEAWLADEFPDVAAAMKNEFTNPDVTESVEMARAAWDRASLGAAPAEAREPSDTYPGTNLEIIEKAIYCVQHGELESVENWLDHLRERLAVPADAGEAVAWICSGSNDFAPIVRDRAAALRLSQVHGDGKIVPLGIVPDVVSQGAQGGKGGEA